MQELSRWVRGIGPSESELLTGQQVFCPLKTCADQVPSSTGYLRRMVCAARQRCPRYSLFFVSCLLPRVFLDKSIVAAGECKLQSARRT
jgi:hypothetical protein